MILFQFRGSSPAHFKPGQYALIDLPGVTGARAYSMCNLPNEEGYWSFLVKRMPSGKGSSVLFDVLQLGDQVSLDGPFGLAYLRTDKVRDIICIAGGSGLSPVLSVMAGAAREPALDHCRISLYYGGRTPRDLGGLALIHEDCHLRERARCVAAISDPSSSEEWFGEQGFVHDVLRRGLAEQEPRSFEYYFCGPPPMADAVQKLLLIELRVPARQLHFDRFL